MSTALRTTLSISREGMTWQQQQQQQQCKLPSEPMDAAAGGVQTTSGKAHCMFAVAGSPHG
jgi:hypothetical protein